MFCTPSRTAHRVLISLGVQIVGSHYPDFFPHPVCTGVRFGLYNTGYQSTLSHPFCNFGRNMWSGEREKRMDAQRGQKEETQKGLSVFQRLPFCLKGSCTSTLTIVIAK